MIPVSSLCSVEDCTGVHYAKGLCNKHYYRLKRNGHLGLLKGKEPVPVSEPTPIEGCRFIQLSKGIHYAIVDEEDYELVMAKTTNWQVCHRKTNTYAFFQKHDRNGNIIDFCYLH